MDARGVQSLLLFTVSLALELKLKLECRGVATSDAWSMGGKGKVWQNDYEIKINYHSNLAIYLCFYFFRPTKNI